MTGVYSKAIRPSVLYIRVLVGLEIHKSLQESVKGYKNRLIIKNRRNIVVVWIIVGRTVYR